MIPRNHRHKKTLQRKIPKNLWESKKKKMKTKNWVLRITCKRSNYKLKKVNFACSCSLVAGVIVVLFLKLPISWHKQLNKEMVIEKWSGEPIKGYKRDRKESKYSYVIDLYNHFRCRVFTAKEKKERKRLPLKQTSFLLTLPLPLFNLFVLPSLAL